MLRLINSSAADYKPKDIDVTDNERRQIIE